MPSTTPAVNSPLLSMNGGTTPSVICVTTTNATIASTMFNNLSIGSVATIDTTVNSVLDATMSFSSIAGSQTASCMTGSIEILF